MRTRIALVIFLFLVSSAHAQETFEQERSVREESWRRQSQAGSGLTEQDMERVKAFKALVRDVDMKSLQQTIREIESADYPQLELQMKEAMAKTYADIVLEQTVVEQKQKEWLYSMVTMNMAYLQFGADQGDSGTVLNRMILRKLKRYLPSDILNHPGFLQRVE